MYGREYGGGKCRCSERINYAIQSHRIIPKQLNYTSATLLGQTALEVKEAMEDIDDLSQRFSFCKAYQSPESLKDFLQKFLDSTSFSVVGNA